MANPSAQPLIAIACGGTGGHLFPGLAVAAALQQQGCELLVLISPKEVDQHAVRATPGRTVATLPAVGLTRGNVLRFLAGFGKSYFAARKLYHQRLPQAVLAMGGFTSAPPVLAGRRLGAAAFLHESNCVPGRANRWLAPFVHQAYVGFPQAAGRLRCRDMVATGTPVRPEFLRLQPAVCREALGLANDRPVLLVTGGSQGASAINRLIIEALPLLRDGAPDVQFLHLTGGRDETAVRTAYARHQATAIVRAFLGDMHLALGAATVAVSRAGASSLAELAAVRLPALLIPYPSAADEHQFHNARAYAESGAAGLRRQAELTPRSFADEVLGLLHDDARRQSMRSALARWDAPGAAQRIADHMLARLQALGRWPVAASRPSRATDRQCNMFAGARHAHRG